MSVPQRLTLVTLGVADVDRSTVFYEALGWTRSSASVDGVVTFFQMGGSALGLFGVDALRADAGQASPTGSSTDSFHGVSVSINMPSPAEVDAVYESWLAAGATVVKRPSAAVWGGYSGYVADPDGHLWELAYNPGFPLSEDGDVHLPI